MDAIESAWKDGDFAIDSLRTPTAFARLRQQVFTKDWVVYAKRPFGGDEAVFKYLARYTHRVAISNQRLVSFDDDLVRFITRGDDRAALPIDDFISRFMQHLLPPRFFKIRRLGLYASSNVRGRLEKARSILAAARPTVPRRVTLKSASPPPPVLAPARRSSGACDSSSSPGEIRSSVRRATPSCTRRRFPGRRVEWTRHDTQARLSDNPPSAAPPDDARPPLRPHADDHLPDHRPGLWRLGRSP
jgi:hypothetical protein